MSWQCCYPPQANLSPLTLHGKMTEEAPPEWVKSLAWVFKYNSDRLRNECSLSRVQQLAFENIDDMATICLFVLQSLSLAAMQDSSPSQDSWHVNNWTISMNSVTNASQQLDETHNCFDHLQSMTPWRVQHSLKSIWIQHAVIVVSLL